MKQKEYNYKGGKYTIIATTTEGLDRAWVKIKAGVDLLERQHAEVEHVEAETLYIPQIDPLPEDDNDDWYCSTVAVSSAKASPTWADEKSRTARGLRSV